MAHRPRLRRADEHAPASPARHAAAARTTTARRAASPATRSSTTPRCCWSRSWSSATRGRCCPTPPRRRPVYTFLYTWHVPAFVLVTGYLSRSFTFTRAQPAQAGHHRRGALPRLRDAAGAVPHLGRRTRTSGSLYLRPALADVVPHGAVPLAARHPAAHSASRHPLVARGRGLPGRRAEHRRLRSTSPRTLGLLPFFVAGLIDDAASSSTGSRAPRVRVVAVGAAGAAFVVATFVDAGASARSGSTGAPATPTSASRSGSARPSGSALLAGGRRRSRSARSSLIPPLAALVHPARARPAWSSTSSTASS